MMLEWKVGTPEGRGLGEVLREADSGSRYILVVPQATAGTSCHREACGSSIYKWGVWGFQGLVTQTSGSHSVVMQILRPGTYDWVSHQ